MKVAIALFSTLLLSTVCLAVQPHQVDNHPCKELREKACKGLKRGEGLFKCMKEHASEGSPECQAKMKEREEKVLEKHPCLAEREKFCKGKERGDMHACMQAHESELSAACKTKRAERKEKHQK